MKTQASPLMKYLGKLDGPVLADKMSPAMRTHIISSSCLDIVTSWPLKTAVKMISALRKNQSLQSLFVGTHQLTAPKQLKFICQKVAKIVNDYNENIKLHLLDTLALVATKSWDMDSHSTSYETVLNPETEQHQIDIINNVQPEQIASQTSEELRVIAQQFSNHAWLSKHFSPSDSDEEKIIKAINKIRKRSKNREDARRSREKKRKALEVSEERNVKRHQQQAAAGFLAHSHLRMHSLRVHKHVTTLNKKAGVFF